MGVCVATASSMSQNCGLEAKRRSSPLGSSRPLPAAPLPAGDVAAAAVAAVPGVKRDGLQHDLQHGLQHDPCRIAILQAFVSLRAGYSNGLVHQMPTCSLLSSSFPARRPRLSGPC